MNDVPDAPGDGFSQLVGLEYLGLDGEHARGRLAVRPEVLQPFGNVHGGALATLAESLCSRATHEKVADDGMIALGQTNQTTFLRPVSEGHVNAEAVVRHRGRTTWVWDCELTDDQGRVCALSRMIVAVRPAQRD